MTDEHQVVEIDRNQTASPSSNNESMMDQQDLEQRFQKECDDLMISISSNMQTLTVPATRLEDAVASKATAPPVETLYNSRVPSIVSSSNFEPLRSSWT